MVLDRKKRTAPQPAEASEISAKKHKGEESRVPPPVPLNAKEGKESKSKKKVLEKRSIKVEPVEVHTEDAVVPIKADNNNDIPSWPEDHLWELMKRMEKSIPPRDSLRFDSRVEKLDWEEVSFASYTGAECKAMWSKIQKRLRRYRLLRELLEDAKTWVTQPWTNFYRSTKQNRHPDLPRRPLSTYMLFYLEKKDKVAKEHPGLEMTAVSKHIATMYKSLSKKKKQKYIDKAAEERREYEEKLEEFYRLHPDMVPKSTPKDKPPPQMEPGPRRPCTPFKLYYLEKLKTHRDDPDFRQEKCKEMWKAVNDKKKLVWINRALEDETRYQAELKVYMRDNPNFVPQPLKPVLTKDEKQLKERLAGKPEKPPNSGYSLFSRIMLASDEMKKYSSKGRMLEISKMWKDLSAIDKKKYHDKVQQMIDQYKLEYATYLESLPENERKEELLLTTHRKKKVVPEKPAVEKPPPSKGNNVVPAKAAPPVVPPPSRKNQEKEAPPPPRDKKAKKEWKQTLYQGEPEPPPVTAFQLFLKSFMSDATHIPPATRMKEAPRYWEMLPESEKAKHRKKLGELKQKYIANYEKFLKGLSQEQLKEYSTLKSNCTRYEEMKEEEDSDADDDDDDDDEDDDDEGREGESVDGGEDEDDADEGDGAEESEEEEDESCPKNQANEGSDSSEDSSSGSDSEDSDSSDSGSNNSDSESDASNSD